MKVFVPMVPSRFDRELRAWIPSVDISPAAKHGEIVVLLPPDAAKAGPAPCVAAMKEKMAGIAPGDALLAVGDPSLIVAAGMIAARLLGGRVTVLKWDRAMREYLPVELNV